VKTKRIAPLGCYSASQAATRLGIHIDTFYRQIRENKINLSKIDSKRESFFLKKDVDSIARYKELGIIAELPWGPVFKRADCVEELQGIVDLCVPIYGARGTPTLEHRAGLWKRNPDIYYVAIQSGIVVGYISLTWLREDLRKAFMQPSRESRSEILSTLNSPDTIHRFVPGLQIDHLFVSTSVHHGLPLFEKRDCGRILIRHTLDVLISLAKRDMPVRTLIACSSRGDGIRAARKLGMREISYDGDPELRFELDIASSNNKFLRPYQDALRVK